MTETRKEKLFKMAVRTIDMGDPQRAGKGIADIVHFLLQRIDPLKRPAAIKKLRYKIWNLDEGEISSKKTPGSASMGQAITFIKTILIGHNPTYIRNVLSHIYRYL